MTQRFNRFADWCRHKDDLSPEARHTVKVLLELAGTSDGDEAERILSSHTELYIGNKQISDITPLSGLTNLTSLTLYGNQISDITPLSGLTNLTSLPLYDNQISDITPLSGLTNLTRLYLDNNQISNIIPLSGLTNLTELHLRNNQISDITPLSNLINLTYLWLNNNQISDITSLSSLTNLIELEFYNNQISDITPLSSLTNLTELEFYNNQISDITPLSGLTNLTTLYLGKNQISDITPLSGLTNLTKLSLDNNQISNIAPLSGLTNLTRLYLDNNQISNIIPLYGLTELDALELDNNPISNLKLPTALQQQWRNLSTEPIAHQQATIAVKSTYASINFAEPEIIFCSSPYAALVSLGECESLGNPLAEMLSDDPPDELLSWGLWDSLYSAYFAMLFQLRWAIETPLAQQLKDDGMKLRNFLTPEELVKFISRTQFYASEFGCVLEQEKPEVLQEVQEVLRCCNLLFSSCGWIFPYEKVCVVCDRPRILSFDNQERLHAEGSPAVQFADGWSVYAYHGVRLPEKYGKVHPNQWQSQWLLEEENAELRRVLIQGIGYARICQELQAIALDSWQEYTLIKINSDVDVEPIYLVKMTCPSTGYIHALRVPPDIQSAREAISWVNWGVAPEEFAIQT